MSSLAVFVSHRTSWAPQHSLIVLVTGLPTNVQRRGQRSTFHFPTWNEMRTLCGLKLIRSCTMFYLDAPAIAAIAGVITALSTLVWALRRKP